MQHLTAHYIDAKDGRPANLFPLRHGPALPHPALIVDAVDRRAKPAIIIGRLPDTVPLPPAATVITEQQHADLLTDYNTWRAQIHLDNIEQLRAVKSQQIDGNFTAVVDQIRAGYPDYEIESWPQQQAQAERYAADNTAPVPLLEHIAAAKGLAVADVVERILANATAYSQAYGQALGTKQRRQEVLAAIDANAPDAAAQIDAV